MVQKVIGVSGNVYERLQIVQMEMAAIGKVFSIGRIVDYLLGCREIMHSRGRATMEIADPNERFQALQQLFTAALTYEPAKSSVGKYKRSSRAGVMAKLDALQQLRDRLGIANPTMAMVDWFINHGTDQMMRDLAVARMQGKDLLGIIEALQSAKP